MPTSLDPNILFTFVFNQLKPKNIFDQLKLEFG